MNTTYSIFNRPQLSHIVIGGIEKEACKKNPNGTAVLLLNRSGGRARSRVLENLSRHGFEEIISLDNKGMNSGVHELSRHFPSVRFVISLEEASQGELLNLGFSLLESSYVLVLQDEMCLDDINYDNSIDQKLRKENVFCVCPKLHSSITQNIPVLLYPLVKKSQFSVEMDLPCKDGEKTFYAYDYAGFYDRKKFLCMGGSDPAIKCNYWQKLDLFFRAWLWGEKTIISSSFNLNYGGEVPVEEKGADLSYLRFYLKNLLPVFESDHAFIPFSKFLPFKMRSHCGWTESFRQFSLARKWVEENRYLFKTDAVSLIENWEETGGKK